MPKRKKEVKAKGGRMKLLVRTVVAVVKKYPEYLEEENEYKLHYALKQILEGYGKMGECFNCGRSMAIVERVAGLHVALLLLVMAKDVRDRMKLGFTFTESNRVDIPRLLTTDAIRHQTTIASYLGLIKQPENIKNTGYWVITSWGWKALRGEPVPRTAKYWNGKFLGRSAETITLAGMFRTHREQIQRAIALKKRVRTDFTGQVADYNPNDWAEFGGYMGEEDKVE